MPYNDEWRIIKLVLAVDVDAHVHEFLTFAEVAVAACNEELVKLIALIKRIILAQNAVLDQFMLLVELALQAKLCHYHVETPESCLSARTLAQH